MHEIIVGKFIDLTKITVDDAGVTLKWRCSSRAQLLNPGAQDIDAQINFIRSRPENEFNYLISLKNGVKVGMISLIRIDRLNKNAETARFLIGEEELVKGLPVAVEAMKLLYDLAFKHLELERVYGYISAENKLMVKWQIFMGMTKEGVLRNHLLSRDSKFVDAIAMGLLKDDYFNRIEMKYNNMINFGMGKKNAT